MVKSSYYPPILSVNTVEDDQVTNGQKESLTLLELMIKPEEVKDTSSLANSIWPELSRRKRGRHSYAYYQSDFN